MTDTEENGNAIPPEEIEGVVHEIKTDDTANTTCCAWRKFEGVETAQGYSVAAVGSGSIAIANVFLSTSFIWLASKEAGCINPETGKLAACNVRVYGFFPTTFITNIAAVAGVLAAFMLPVIGAIIDYTEHRQTVGRVVAFLIWAIQTTQIATIEKTWFHMAILQSIVVALFEVHYCLAVSYLPDIARYEVNHDTMTRFNRYFFTMQYSGQTTFLIITLLVSWWFELTSVQNAQLGQSACSFVVLICYTRAWTKLPAARGRRKLPEGRSLLLEGFRQNYRTFVEINRNPNKTLKWFFLTVIIAESGGTSLLPTVVSYLSRVYGYGSLDVGLTFLLAVIFAIPGAIVSAYLAKKTSPKTSLRIDFVCTFVVTVIAFFVLRKENPRFLGYLWGLMWGFCLGWFYSGEQLFYTLCVPPDQEAELAGFFVYCTIIMTWVPSLLYSIIVEKGKDEQYGLIPICILQLLSMISISMIPEWDDVLEGSKLRLSAQASQERDGTQPINSSLQEGVDGGH